jgi:light-regulated signal transduction histidine kinase (bacteriophytochrome)
MDERSADYMERMLNAIRRMQSLINDLLTYSRVTTKALPFTRVNLAEIVAHVLGDLEVRIEQTGASIDVAALPEIDADATQMRQLFQNLIGNALKFNRPGVPPVLRIQYELESRTGNARTATLAKITISDNGIGFDEKYAEQIFVIFQRLHGRMEYEGTGIGLAVCKKIVDRHGGTISASSTPGAGATFVIHLPLTRGETLNVER